MPGADVILTNTFGGNRFRLDVHGLAARAGELNRAAAALARDAGARFVAGSMGPLGVRLAPYGRVRPEDAFAAYREQAVALAEGGVDLLIIETQTDLREMEQALAAAREGAPGARRRGERDVHEGRSNAPRLVAGAGRRAPHRARRGRDRRELRRGSGAAAPRDTRACGRPPASCRSWRARTPAVPRRSAVGSCTRRRPSTWRSTHARSWTKASRSSVGAAGPARLTRWRSRRRSECAHRGRESIVAERGR